MRWKGKLGKEDIEFGTSDFLRKNSRGAYKILNQINFSHIYNHINVVQLGTFDTYTYMTPNQPPTIYHTLGSGLSNTITLPRNAYRGMGPYIFCPLGSEWIIVRTTITSPFRGFTYGDLTSNDNESKLIVWCDIPGKYEYQSEGYWLEA